MSEKKTGIVDPWRIVEPLKAPKPATPEPNRKIDLNEIDFDADLRSAQTCIFKSDYGSVIVTARDLETQSHGLRHLVRCLFEILGWPDGQRLLEAASIGLEYGPRIWLKPSDGERASLLQTTEDFTPRSTIWFIRQTYDDGMRALIKLLNDTRKRVSPTENTILKRWGITPTIR